MIEQAASLLYDKGMEMARRQARAGSGGGNPRIAVINGIAGQGLKALASIGAKIGLQQQQREAWLGLKRAGFSPLTRLRDGEFDMVLVLAGRQREQTLGWLAEGMDMLAEDGVLALAAANNAGAKGYEKRLREVAPVQSVSKSKCRCMFLHRRDIASPEVAAAWREQAKIRYVNETGLYSAPGVFSWDRADVGSSLLLEHLPDNLAGNGMDLGCGNGYLSVHVLGRYAGIRAWHAVDADALALDCARRNLTGAGKARVQFHWLDATREALPRDMDVVLMNPPFHKSRADCVTLGRAMIEAAAGSLHADGSLFLVANRHLPYEALLGELFGRVATLVEGQGYKVMRCSCPLSV